MGWVGGRGVVKLIMVLLKTKQKLGLARLAKCNYSHYEGKNFGFLLW